MQIGSLLDRLFRRDRLDSSMDEELQFHIAERAADLERSGMTASEALRKASLEFGPIEKYKEECRETRRFNALHTFIPDLRFGLRIFLKNPAFSMLAVLCLTLGIGANTAVFSWIEGTLIRPYPLVQDQERLFVIAGTVPGGSHGGLDEISWPDFLDFQRSCHLIDSFIAEKITGATLSLGDHAEHATGSLVSANYFQALGIRPILGRGFEAGEDQGRNAHPVVVISYQFWKDHFNSDPAIIGKIQRFNNVPFTIIGVAPKAFYGTFVGYSWQFWVPASMQERFASYTLEDRGAHWIEGFVKLRAGVTASQAEQQIAAAAKRLEKEYPETNRGRGIKLFPLWQSPFNNSKVVLPTLQITIVVVLFVLLIACANVSNLLLVRAFARRHEMTVRLAIGARPRRLIRQLLTEGLVLSAFGAAGGLLVAYWSRNLLTLLLPPRGTPMYLGGQIDWRVLVLSASVCILATLLFGLFPAMQASKLDITDALKSESSGVVGGRGKSWLRSTFVLLQISLSFVLLVGAGLLFESLQKIRTASPGFETQKVLTTWVNLFATGYDDPRAKNFQDQLIDRVRSLPGVQSAAYARIKPFDYYTYVSSNITVDGYTPAPNEQPSAQYNEVSPSYFSTMGIPLISGRDFKREDDENGALVAIVDQTMAAKYWPGGDPVSKRVQVAGKWMTVVGVARNAKYENMLETRAPFFYLPLRQDFSATVALFVRTHQAPASMATSLAREFHSLDPNLPLYPVITMQEQVNRQTSAQTVAGRLLGIFGGLALLLATIGLYGVMSYAVSQSKRELGLRMAMGAAPSHLLRLVLSRGIVLTAAGIILGFVAALISTRLLGYLLYNVSPRDPLSFGLALFTIAAASLIACFLPAWRASRIDPLRALGG